MNQSASSLARQDSPKRELDFDTVSGMTGYSPEQIALIVKTVAKDAPLLELATFLHACNKLHLDPLLKQAYWVRRKSREQIGGQWQDVHRGTLQIGIDGFRSLADRQGNYAGSEPAEFRDWAEITDEKSGEIILVPGLARVVVWKLVQGRSCAFTGEASWREFYPGSGANGQMWRRMPKHMLAKCAEAQALRKGWPALLGSLDMLPMDDGAADSDVVDLGDAAPIGRPQTVVSEAPPARAKPDYANTYKRVYGTEEEYDTRVSAPQAATPPPPQPDPPDSPPDNDDEVSEDEDEQDEPEAPPSAELIARYQRYLAACKRALGDQLLEADWQIEGLNAREIEHQGVMLTELLKSAGEDAVKTAQQARRTPVGATERF